MIRPWRRVDGLRTATRRPGRRSARSRGGDVTVRRHARRDPGARTHDSGAGCCVVSARRRRLRRAPAQSRSLRRRQGGTMRDVVLTVAAAAAGYLLGTIPSAGVVAWLATRGEINLREAGSGNPGAINAIKMLGTRWGLVVLVADIAKGAAAGLLGLAIGGDPGAYAAATAAIAGHIFPVWSGFRGGKGVATS